MGCKGPDSPAELLALTGDFIVVLKGHDRTPGDLDEAEQDFVRE